MLGESSSDDVVVTTAAATDTRKQPVWHEVKNDDGSSYYWNTVTNETTWDTPDNFLSLVEQEKQKLKKSKSDKIKEKQKKEMHKEAVKEVNAHMARERMRELAPKCEEKSPPVAAFGPAPRAPKPYGSWTPVVNEPTQNIDLQLPKTKEVEPPPVVMEPETVEFREKRVESLGDGPVEFKRRKFNNARRNMRQKLDDE